MSSPDHPETRSPRNGGNRARADRKDDIQHLETTPAELQAQRLRRLYALTLSAAYAVAELAYAAGVR